MPFAHNNIFFDERVLKNGVDGVDGKRRMEEWNIGIKY